MPTLRFHCWRTNTALDVIALLGFEGVDIGLFEDRSHLWPSRVFKRLEPSARELAAKLADRNLTPADVFLQTAADFVSLAPNHPDAKRRRKARELFTRTLDFAAALDCSHVTALPGVAFPDEPRSASLRARATSWRGERPRGHSAASCSRSKPTSARSHRARDRRSNWWPKRPA